MAGGFWFAACRKRFSVAPFVLQFGAGRSLTLPAVPVCPRRQGLSRTGSKEQTRFGTAACGSCMTGRLGRVYGGAVFKSVGMARICT
nr:MAG TPA: hypothetical protein [Caudoviricetes sp.]